MMLLYSIALCLMMSAVAMGIPRPRRRPRMPCPKIYKPVCGSNTKTYNNLCLLKRDRVRLQRNIYVAHPGKCSDSTFECDFSRILARKPVCGSNGKTYFHECFLKAANCHYDAKITILHKGPCTNADLPCPRVYEPVCANNGETYDSICMLKFAASNTKVEITIAHKGACEKKRDDHCYFVGIPRHNAVCGTDGKSYFNPCLMHAQACLNNVKIEVARKGFCA